MLVHLARIDGQDDCDVAVDDFEELASRDTVQRHHLTPDPDAADLILFTQCHNVDWRLRAIRSHPLTRRFRSKVMVYDQRDRPWRSFPGVYVSTPASQFDDRSQRAWGYPRTPAGEIPAAKTDLLFSFVGSPTSPCRVPLFGLNHPEGHVEEVRDFMFWDGYSPSYSERKAHYQEVLGRSKFVLCPRGRGTSSFRLYEALAARRVPVIISDEWVPPRGPDWDACSLRWPEGRTSGLVAFLEGRAGDWEIMSASAGRAHEKFFHVGSCFHNVVEQCADLLGAGVSASASARVLSRSVAAAARERLAR